MNCRSCGLTYTDYRAETIRDAAVANLRASLCTPHWLTVEETMALTLKSHETYRVLATDDNGRWYFYDETGCVVYGPLPDQEVALVALEDYADKL